MEHPSDQPVISRKVDQQHKAKQESIAFGIQVVGQTNLCHDTLPCLLKTLTPVPEKEH